MKELKFISTEDNPIFFSTKHFSFDLQNIDGSCEANELINAIAVFCLQLQYWKLAICKVTLLKCTESTVELPFWKGCLSYAYLDSTPYISRKGYFTVHTALKKLFHLA